MCTGAWQRSPFQQRGTFSPRVVITRYHRYKEHHQRSRLSAHPGNIPGGLRDGFWCRRCLMVLPQPRKAAAIGAKMLPKQQNAKTALCAEHFLGCLVSYGDRGRLFAPVQTLFSEHCFCGTKHRTWSELPWAHPPLYSPTRRVPVARYLLFASPPLPRALLPV